MPEATTIGSLNRLARQRLAAAGVDSPALDARLLICASFDLTAAQLHLNAERRVTPDEAARFEALLARRAAGEPVFRILGARPFWNHVFTLSPDTLEPRPDTEALVDLAVRVLDARFGRQAPFRFVDVGTGTGAIAISLLAEFAQAQCLAIDIAPGALDMAVQNAHAAGVAERFAALQADYLAGVTGPCDAILSNPPYIASATVDALDRDVRDHDPRRALDGGPDGLDAYRAIAAGAATCLAADGDLFLEIGQGQGPEVVSLMQAQGLIQSGSADDLSGTERALWFRRRTA